MGITNAAGGLVSSVASLAFVDLKMFAGVIINGTIGDNYSVESMPVLGGTNWTTRTNLTLSTPTYIYIDYNSPTNAHHYYRAVPLP